jgi:hypothetical protein
MKNKEQIIALKKQTEKSEIDEAQVFPVLPKSAKELAEEELADAAAIAWRKLILSGTILFGLMLINTGMLSQILRDTGVVPATMTLAGIPLSYVFAFILTLVEAGLGIAHAATHEKESDKFFRNLAVMIKSSFMIVFALILACVDGFFYSRFAPSTGLFTVPFIYEMPQSSLFFLGGFVLAMTLFSLGFIGFEAAVTVLRGTVLKELTIFLARQAAHEKDLTQLATLLAPLPKGKKGFLAQTPRLREMVGDIAGIQMRLNTVNRPVLRDPIAQMLRERIENFRHQIGGFNEPLASEFRQAATQWLEIAQKQVQEAQAILTKEPSPVVFRAGDPVNREQEAFVPRYGVVGDLDKQIMLSTGCPGLVLYGRRRMGKSTVLHNLNGFLPATVIPVVISMQDPQAFTSLADLLYLISQKLMPAVGGETGNTVANINLNGFMQQLAQSNEKLQAAGKRVLLAIDEYENIDRKLGEKIFPEDLLITVRESIQTHRQITWIFAGSHDITELQHAEWPSYLVSARTIEVPLFTLAETRLLLTEPMKFSPLWPKDDPKRPRFAPEFWGEGGIERIHHEAGGWPHLVQLIAETIVDLINDETKRQVDAELFERSLNKAIISGHNVLYQLMRGESTLPGEWDYLAAFRKRETQPPPEDEAIYASLRRRLLVEEDNGQWRLRVPLMARWLKERG